MQILQNHKHFKNSILSNVFAIGEFSSEQNASSENPCSTCEIFRDGKAISAVNKNNTALPGHLIELSISCDNLTNVQWEIPNTIFSNYIASLGEASIEYPGESFLTQQTVSFYWADSGSKSVSVTFNRNGTDYTLTASINVIAPICNWVPKVLGAIHIYPPLDDYPESVGFYSDPVPTGYGIDYPASVKIPPGADFLEGQWQIVQLGKGKVAIGKTPGNCVGFDTGDKYVCDADYPGFGPYSTGPTIKPGYDKPSVPVYSHDDGGSLSMANWEFKTYIMFKAGENYSKWVPLMRFDWFCHWYLQKQSGPHWKILDSGVPSSNPTPVGVSDHPLWTGWEPHVPYPPITCPPPP